MRNVHLFAITFFVLFGSLGAIAGALLGLIPLIWFDPGWWYAWFPMVGAILSVWWGSR